MMKDISNDVSGLDFTGERYLPEVRGNIELEHLHRYLLAKQVVAGKIVLDIASGEGYGSAMLAQSAHRVTGVDISHEAVLHAQARYQAKNLEFRLGSCSAIPLGDASVDVVVSFETIEHHDEHEAMMREVKRVLRPGGVMIISSPDKLEYSDKPGYRNPYHIQELYRDEFRKLLDLYFKNHSIYGQRVLYGSAIFLENGFSTVESYELSSNALSAIAGVPYPIYLIAVASDAELPILGSGILEQPINETDLVKGWTGAVAERDAQIAKLHQAMAERDNQIGNLNQAVFEANAQLRAIENSTFWKITFPLRGALEDAPTIRKICRRTAKLVWWGCTLQLGSKLREWKASDETPVERPHCAPPIDDFCVALALNYPASQWNSVSAPRCGVSVILPVYRDVKMTETCIDAAMPGILGIPQATLVIVNDHSPDADMNSMLHKKVAQWRGSIKLLTNERNLGFVASVNKGMRYVENQDIALLNSDVIVPSDWLMRLQDEAYSRPNVATVTPLSNNTTICTFPEFLQDNPVPFGLGIGEVDNVFRYSRLSNVETPTGVGFCMYIRWDCIKTVGNFDEVRFGRGYGEENEFCQRAMNKGWCNLVTPNLYVYHKGGASFGADRAALIANANEVMDKIYPAYHSAVQEFIGRDPLRESRLIRFVDLLASVQAPKVLHVSHGIGGGVDQHIEELATYLYPAVFSLILAPKNSCQAVLRFGYRKTADEVVLNLPHDYDSLVSLLRSLGVSLIHYHHVLNVHPLLYNLSDDLGIKRYLTVHDYYLLTGNPTLTDKHGLYSSADSEKLHNPLFPLPKKITAEEWREKYRSLVEKAECVIFPSLAARSLFGDCYAINREIIAPHLEKGFRNVSVHPQAFPVKASYVIGVLGALGREKGADYLEEVARAAKDAGAALTFVLIGYAYRPLDVITVTGPYRSIDLPDLLKKNHCDAIFFPARWPETYSYTLSAAIESGLPIIAPAIGAFPERLSERKQVMLFTHDIPAIRLLQNIVAFIQALNEGNTHSAPRCTVDKVNPFFYEREYLKWEQQGARGLAPLEDFSHQKILKTLLLNKFSVQRSPREVLLYALWRIYIRPEMSWVNRVIPYTVRRQVKRYLSNRPIHDIAVGR